MSNTQTQTNPENENLPGQLAFTLGDRLAKALSYANVDGIEMAEYLGISRTTVSNYLHGRRAPRLLVLRTWAMRTGVPLHWLQTGHFEGDDTCRLTAGCSAKLSYRGRKTHDSTGANVVRIANFTPARRAA